MFSVPRFDVAQAGAAATNGASGGDAALAALNARIAAKKQANTSSTTAPSFLPAASSSSAAAAAAAGPTIHPSRLAAAPALRASEKKTKSSSQPGAARERTKAKERYLRAKKERRKAKAKAGPKAPGEGKSKKAEAAVPAVPDAAAEAGEEGEGIDEEEVQIRRRREEKARKKVERREKAAAAALVAAEQANKAEEGKKRKREETRMEEDQARSPGRATSPRTAVEAAPAAQEAPDSDESSSSSNDEGSRSDSSEDEEQEDEAKGDATLADETVYADALSSPDAAADADTSDVDMPSDAKATTPPPALSRFPAPRPTLVSSRGLLAAQGLPAGMTDATVVDPTRRAALQEVAVEEGEEGAEEEDAEIKAGKEADRKGLELVSKPMRQKLKSLGISEWFAVQTAVIPLLLTSPQAYALYPSAPPRDVCVSAPTGSGKTLAYAVPLLEVLRRRTVPALRALIVLPTRDLVVQVRDTLQALIGSSEGALRIAAISGTSNWVSESAALSSSAKDQVDILIATPGRLVDHLDSTPGFTLQHLRFLVIDEADRLLAQSFQSWLPRLLAALEPSSAKAPDTPPKSEVEEEAEPEVVAPAWLRNEAAQKGMHVGSSVPRVSVSGACTQLFSAPTNPAYFTQHVQKLLFSATLTRDPAKIAALELRSARFVAVREAREGGHAIDAADDFALPASLAEHMLIAPASEKPKNLLWLLHRSEKPVRGALAFTKSTESAGRLVKLVEFFEEEWDKRKPEEEEADGEEGEKQERRKVVVADYSSDLSPAERTRILNRFKAGEIDLLVASDLISRGIDMPHVHHVISYDAPVDMAKYVHRVGRTARAGRAGDAWSLVEEQEARYFKLMLTRSGRLEKVRKEKPGKKEVKSMEEAYEAALERLAAHFTRR